MISLQDLFTPLTDDGATATVLEIARSVGLDVDAWQPGGVARTLLAIAARALAWVSRSAGAFAAAGLRSYATGDWLTLLAQDMYGVEKRPASYATGKVTLTNAGGGVYAIAPGDLTFSSSSTRKTYRNTSSGTLGALGTLELDIIAEEAGSASTAAIGGVDTLVTVLLGVTCSNAAAVVGVDAETDDEVRVACGESLAALSPGGAADAYTYVATHTKRTDGSTVEINRVRVVADTATGDVTVTLATPSDAPAGADVTLIGDTLERTVVPVGITLATQAVTTAVLSVSYTAYVPSTCTKTDVELTDAVEASLTAYCKTFPIGGMRKVAGTGYVFADLVRARIADAVPEIFSVTLASPAADVALLSTDVPVLSIGTATVVRVQQ